MFTTQKQIRNAFYEVFSVGREYRGKPQNDCPADMRAAFVDFVDSLCRDGTISESLAQRVTL